MKKISTLFVALLAAASIGAKNRNHIGGRLGVPLPL